MSQQINLKSCILKWSKHQFEQKFSQKRNKTVSLCSLYLSKCRLLIAWEYQAINLIFQSFHWMPLFAECWQQLLKHLSIAFILLSVFRQDKKFSQAVYDSGFTDVLLSTDLSLRWGIFCYVPFFSWHFARITFKVRLLDLGQSQQNLPNNPIHQGFSQ